MNNILYLFLVIFFVILCSIGLIVYVFMVMFKIFVRKICKIYFNIIFNNESCLYDNYKSVCIICNIKWYLKKNMKGWKDWKVYNLIFFSGVVWLWRLVL